MRISILPRTADGPRPQHVGPLRRTAKTRSFCAWPSAANRDGSRSVGGSAEMRPELQCAAPGRIQDGSADSHVRAFPASDQVPADKAVRAPVSLLPESTRTASGRPLNHAGSYKKRIGIPAGL